MISGTPTAAADLCRVTTDEGAGLDDDIKRLQGITHTVNEKIKDKRASNSNNRMGEIRSS